MQIKFKTGDKVKFQSQINGNIWEVLSCINAEEFSNAPFEDKFSMKIIPRYSCKGIDENGKEIVNNISENLIEKINLFTL